MIETDTRLEEWSVVDLDVDNPFRAPESRVLAVNGAVYGHPRFEDGERVTTSAVRAVLPGRLVQTGNTIYRLGQVSDTYREWCAENGYGRDLDGDEPLDL